MSSELNNLLTEILTEKESKIIPDNIKQGITIFNIEGNAKTTDFKITNCSYLFYRNSRLDIMDQLLQLCENVTDMSYMFHSCNSLIELDVSMLDTSNVTDMSYMFRSCSLLTELDVSNFNTSNVTNMRDMFWGCSQLTELDLSNFNTSNVIYMDTMFSGCNRLKTLNVKSFNTSNVIRMDTMFANCNSLTELDLSNFDFSKTIHINRFVYSCPGLKDLQFGTNLGKGYIEKSNNYSNYKLNLSDCRDLTHDSLMNVINNLYDLNLTYDVANDGTLYTQQLVLGETNLAKLTADEITIATNKGWTVS